MTKTLAYGYSSESSQWELSNEYQHDSPEPLRHCALDENSLSIGRFDPQILCLPGDFEDDLINHSNIQANIHDIENQIFGSWLINPREHMNG